MNAKKKLTKTLIDGLQARATRYEVKDTEVRGLLVRVYPTGTKTYMIYYRDKRGVQHKDQLGATNQITLDQARDAARAKWAGVVEGVKAQPGAPISVIVTRYVEEHLKFQPGYVAGRKGTYKAAKSILIDTGKLKPIWNIRADEITKADIVNLYDKLVRQISPATANLTLNFISAAWSWAVNRGLCPEQFPVSRHFRRTKTDPRKIVLTHEQSQRVYRAIQARKAGATDYEKRVIAALEVCMWMGVRQIGVSTLKKSQINYQTRMVTFIDKGRKAITRALTPKLDAILSSVPNEGSEWVFPGERARHIKPDRIWSLFKEIREELGLGDVRPHDLRRTYATFAQYEADVAVEDVSKTLGHANTNVTKLHYIHALDRQQAKIDHSVEGMLADIFEAA